MTDKTPQSNYTYRLRRLDERCYVIEKYQPEYIAEKASRHVNIGDMIPGKWVINGYYGKLEHAAKYLLNDVVEGEFYTYEDVIKAIEEAETKIVRMLENDIHNNNT